MNSDEKVVDVSTRIVPLANEKLRWQLDNFELFVNAQVSTITQRFGPFHSDSTELWLSLHNEEKESKKSGKFALKIQIARLKEAKKQKMNLCGQVELHGYEEWRRNFFLPLDNLDETSISFEFPTNLLKEETRLQFKMQYLSRQFHRHSTNNPELSSSREMQNEEENEQVSSPIDVKTEHPRKIELILSENVELELDRIKVEEAQSEVETPDTETTEIEVPNVEETTFYFPDTTQTSVLNNPTISNNSLVTIKEEIRESRDAFTEAIRLTAQNRKEETPEVEKHKLTTSENAPLILYSHYGGPRIYIAPQTSLRPQKIRPTHKEKSTMTSKPTKNKEQQTSKTANSPPDSSTSSQTSVSTPTILKKTKNASTDTIKNHKSKWQQTDDSLLVNYMEKKRAETTPKSGKLPASPKKSAKLSTSNNISLHKYTSTDSPSKSKKKKWSQTDGFLFVDLTVDLHAYIFSLPIHYMDRMKLHNFILTLAKFTRLQDVTEIIDEKLKYDMAGMFIKQILKLMDLYERCENKEGNPELKLFGEVVEHANKNHLALLEEFAKFEEMRQNGDMKVKSETDLNLDEGGNLKNECVMLENKRHGRLSHPIISTYDELVTQMRRQSLAPMFKPTLPMSPKEDDFVIPKNEPAKPVKSLPVTPVKPQLATPIKPQFETLVKPQQTPVQPTPTTSKRRASVSSNVPKQRPRNQLKWKQRQIEEKLDAFWEKQRELELQIDEQLKSESSEDFKSSDETDNDLKLECDIKFDDEFKSEIDDVDDSLKPYNNYNFPPPYANYGRVFRGEYDVLDTDEDSPITQDDPRRCSERILDDEGNIIPSREFFRCMASDPTYKNEFIKAISKNFDSNLAGDVNSTNEQTNPVFDQNIYPESTKQSTLNPKNPDFDPPVYENPFGCFENQPLKLYQRLHRSTTPDSPTTTDSGSAEPSRHHYFTSNKPSKSARDENGSSLPKILQVEVGQTFPFFGDEKLKEVENQRREEKGFLTPKAPTKRHRIPARNNQLLQKIQEARTEIASHQNKHECSPFVPEELLNKLDTLSGQLNLCVHEILTDSCTNDLNPVKLYEFEHRLRPLCYQMECVLRSGHEHSAYLQYYSDNLRQVHNILNQLEIRLMPWRRFLDLRRKIHDAQENFNELLKQMEEVQNREAIETLADLDLSLKECRDQIQLTRQSIPMFTTHVRRLLLQLEDEQSRLEASCSQMLSQLRFQYQQYPSSGPWLSPKMAVIKIEKISDGACDADELL